MLFTSLINKTSNNVVYFTRRYKSGSVGMKHNVFVERRNYT